jgi:hypothetical protein
MKLRSVVDEFFHPDGQMDMAMLICAFRNYANALEKPKLNN